MKTPETQHQSIPFYWFRDHLIDELLPHWYHAASSPNGFFHANLHQDWSRQHDMPGTLVSQSRLLYVFAVGFYLTGQSHYQETVHLGANFLMDHFYDQTDGGYFWACDEQGVVKDDTKSSYGHAFVLFSLSYAYSVTKNEQFFEGAIKAYEVMENKFRDKFGGLISRMTRDWQDDDVYRAQNPLMHYFEALLIFSEVVFNHTIPRKWRDFQSSQYLKQRPAHIADFLFSNLENKSPFFLNEFYTKNWRAYYLDQSGPISIGHHFEWAFLLSKGVQQGMSPLYLRIAKNLLSTAVTFGIHPQNGAVLSYIDASKRVTDPYLYWWEHSEALRTLIHFILLRRRNDLIKPFATVFRFVKNHFLDPAYFGWFTKLDNEGKPVDKTKGSLGKLDYHQTALCSEVIQLESVK